MSTQPSERRPYLVDAPPSWGQCSPGEPALGYVRVQRARDGDEFAGQAEEIRACCVDHGLALLDIARDVEVEPGTPGASPGLYWALERLASGEAHTLVVASLHHLTGAVADLGLILDWFSEQERTLIAIDFHLDTSTEAGELTARTLVGVGAWERRRISVRTRHGLEIARSQGSGRARAAVADIPELRERIARMRGEGMTLRAIAEVLNEEGVPTLRGGAEWRPSSIQVAAGYRRPPSTRNRVDLPAPASRRRDRRTDGPGA
jgi:DNA invertase Pin-like site-specific DNA recombinase